MVYFKRYATIILLYSPYSTKMQSRALPNWHGIFYRQIIQYIPYYKYKYLGGVIWKGYYHYF